MTIELQSSYYRTLMLYGVHTRESNRLRNLLTRTLTELEYEDILTKLNLANNLSNEFQESTKNVYEAIFRQGESEFRVVMISGLKSLLSQLYSSCGSSKDFEDFISKVAYDMIANNVEYVSGLGSDKVVKLKRLAKGGKPHPDSCFTSIITSLRYYLGDKYFEYLPLLFNPYTEEDDTWKLIPLKELLPTMVTCQITNMPFNIRSTFKTAYGTYIAKNTWDADMLGVQSEYAFCSLNTALTGRQDTLIKLSDCVQVFSRSNKIEYKHVYRETAKTHRNWSYNPTNERFYTFNYLEFPYFVMGVGFVDSLYLSVNKCKLEPAFGCYIKGGFRILNKSNNVLDYFEGFKHMPYEQVVKGSKRKEENTLFMGVELEVEMSHNSSMDIHLAARHAMLDMNKHAITCEDGSLRNGFEVISVPCTLAYHYGVWEKMLRGELRKHLISYNSSRCGIHVHMSKSAFSTIGLGRFAWFINAKVNKDFVNHVAQRDTGASGGTDWAAKSPTDISKANEMIRTNNYIDSSGNRMGKYSAVNLCRMETVEVRIFKGTLHYPSVMKNLEFCHALHAYCHTVASYCNTLKSNTRPSSEYSLDYKGFCHWLACDKTGNRKAYPNLFNFLKAGGFISDKLPSVKVLKNTDVADEQVIDLKVAPPVLEQSLSDEVQAKMRMLTASRSRGLNYERAMAGILTSETLQQHA